MQVFEDGVASPEPELRLRDGRQDLARLEGARSLRPPRSCTEIQEWSTAANLNPLGMWQPREGPRRPQTSDRSTAASPARIDLLGLRRIFESLGILKASWLVAEVCDEGREQERVPRGRIASWTRVLIFHSCQPSLQSLLKYQVGIDDRNGF